MQQLLGLLLGQGNPATVNLMSMAQSAGLIDLAMQGYNAYKMGKLPEFVAYQYENNLSFRKFYDKYKGQTLEEFFTDNGIKIG